MNIDKVALQLMETLNLSSSSISTNSDMYESDSSSKNNISTNNELELSNFIPSHSFGVKPISAKLSFLVFLWYMANMEPLGTLANNFDISISSIFRVLRRVIAWLLTRN